MVFGPTESKSAPGREAPRGHTSCPDPLRSMCCTKKMVHQPWLEELGGQRSCGGGGRQLGMPLLQAGPQAWLPGWPSVEAGTKAQHPGYSQALFPLGRDPMVITKHRGGRAGKRSWGTTIFWPLHLPCSMKLILDGLTSLVPVPRACAQ